MSKLTASKFRVRASSQGYTTLNFTNSAGRDVEIKFPSIGLENLIEHLRKASGDAPIPMTFVRLDESTRWSKRSDPSFLVDAKKHPEKGANGGFAFGTNADFSRVLLTVDVPGLGEVDVLLPISDAQGILDNLAKTLTLVKTDVTITKQ